MLNWLKYKYEIYVTTKYQLIAWNIIRIGLYYARKHELLIKLPEGMNQFPGLTLDKVNEIIKGNNLVMWHDNKMSLYISGSSSLYLDKNYDFIEHIKNFNKWCQENNVYMIFLYEQYDYRDISLCKYIFKDQDLLTMAMLKFS